MEEKNLSEDSKNGEIEEKNIRPLLENKPVTENQESEKTFIGEEESFTEKTMHAWEKGKVYANRTVGEMNLKRKISSTKAEKELTIKKLGEEIYKFTKKHMLEETEFSDSIKAIDELSNEIDKKNEELKKLDESQNNPKSFFNKVKLTISKYAGYTKLKLDISMLKNDYESKIASLGQFVYSRQESLKDIFLSSEHIIELFKKIESLEKEAEHLEEKLNNEEFD